MAELRVAAGERQGLAVAEIEPHPARADLPHDRLAAVHEAARLVIHRPSDAVARPDADARRLVEPEPVAHPVVARPDVQGAQGAPRRMLQEDELPLRAYHPADVAFLHAQRRHARVEQHDVARLVVAQVGPLRRRQVPVHIALDLEFPPVQHALARQPVPHRPVDLCPDEMRRRQDRRPRPLAGIERKPDAGRLRAQLLLRRLVNMFEPLQRLPGAAFLQMLDGGLQRRVALAQDLLHLRRRHARLLQRPERLAGGHGAKLAPVADQHQTRDPQPLRNPQQQLHLRRRDHRRLVQHQHRALVFLPVPRHARGVAEVAMAGEEPLQRARPGTCLLPQDPRGGGRRRQQDRLALAQQSQRLLQHGRLAGAGRALHRDDPVVRQQDRAHRLLLPFGEHGFGKPAPDGSFLRHRLRCAQGLAPVGHDRALQAERLPGGEGPAARNLRFHQVAVGNQPRHRCIDIPEFVPAGRMPERERPDVGLPDDRGALGQMFHRAPDHLPRAQPRRLGPELLRRAQIGPAHLARRLLRCPGPAAEARLRDAAVPDKPELLDPRLPRRPQIVDVLVRLLLAGDQCRLLRQRRAPGQSVLVQPRQDFAAPGRKRVHERPPVARDLEPRHAADHRRLDPEPERQQAPRQVLAVDGPDQPHIAPHLRRLDAPPFARPVARHVGDDAVRVKLRVLVPARQVPEPGRHQTVRRNARALLGHRIVRPRLQQLRLQPVERCLHRRIVRAQNPPVAIEKRLQRDRLRRRQREVETRPVLALPVTRPAEPDIRARHMAEQNALEAPRRDMLRQAERPRRAPVPEARPALPRVVLRVVALLREILDRHRGPGEVVQVRNHASRSASRRGTGSLPPAAMVFISTGPGGCM